MTEFTQLYLTPKIFLMGSSLAFILKEDPVRCAKVCDESWVILMNWCNLSIQLMLQRFDKQLILNAKYFSCFFRWGKCQWSKHDVPLLLRFASFPLWRRTRSGLVTSQLHRHSDPELTKLLGNWNENNTVPVPIY